MTDPAPLITVEMTDVRVIEPDSPLELTGDSPPPARTARPRTRWLGVTALVGVIVAAGVQGAAIVIASGHDIPGSTTLAWVAIVLSVVAAVVGMVAAVIGRGRSWGLVAAVLAVVTNPWVLLQLLRFLA